MIGIADVERTCLGRNGKRRVECDIIPVLRDTLGSTFSEVYTIEVTTYPNAQRIDVELRNKGSTDFTQFVACKHLHLVGRQEDGRTGPRVLLRGDIGEIFVSG